MLLTDALQIINLSIEASKNRDLLVTTLQTAITYIQEQLKANDIDPKLKQNLSNILKKYQTRLKGLN